MKKKSQKPYLTDYNVLIAQDLWQALFQILLIILLTELINLNVNMSMITKNVNFMKLDRNIAAAFFNTQTLKII